MNALAITGLFSAAGTRLSTQRERGFRLDEHEEQQERGCSCERSRTCTGWPHSRYLAICRCEDRHPQNSYAGSHPRSNRDWQRQDFPPVWRTIAPARPLFADGASHRVFGSTGEICRGSLATESLLRGSGVSRRKCRNGTLMKSAQSQEVFLDTFHPFVLTQRGPKTLETCVCDHAHAENKNLYRAFLRRYVTSRLTESRKVGRGFDSICWRRMVARVPAFT